MNVKYIYIYSYSNHAWNKKKQKARYTIIIVSAEVLTEGVGLI